MARAAGGDGLEVDKMNRIPLRSHFDAYVGNLLQRLPPDQAASAWKHVVADSYETGPQNWTDGFAADFQKRYGYDPLPFLPVMTGRIVGSVDQSDRFLWDLRRMVADRIAQRLCRRTARFVPRARHEDVAGELRALGISQRVPALWRLLR